MENCGSGNIKKFVRKLDDIYGGKSLNLWCCNKEQGRTHTKKHSFKSRSNQISFKLSRMRKMTIYNVRESLFGKLPLHLTT